jgi:hypothetical protein
MKMNGFDAKDAMRIEGIVRKALGRSWKKIPLAHQMADSIKDAGKALRRARAAVDAGEPEIAAIFFIRYGRLTA